MVISDHSQIIRAGAACLDRGPCNIIQYGAVRQLVVNLLYAFSRPV